MYVYVLGIPIASRHIYMAGCGAADPNCTVYMTNTRRVAVPSECAFRVDVVEGGVQLHDKDACQSVWPMVHSTAWQLLVPVGSVMLPRLADAGLLNVKLHCRRVP